jgi:hypothetical protein
MGTDGGTVTGLKIFVAYAAEQRTQARSLVMALRATGHHVFFDRDDLPAGGEFHERIRKAIRASDLFVFLVSPQSIEKGAYTLTELKHWRRVHKSPAGRVIPVVVVPTDFGLMPTYLTAVSVVEPEGNLDAEVIAAVREAADAIAAEADARRSSAKPASGYETSSSPWHIHALFWAWVSIKSLWILLLWLFSLLLDVPILVSRVAPYAIVGYLSVRLGTVDALGPMPTIEGFVSSLSVCARAGGLVALVHSFRWMRYVVAEDRWGIGVYFATGAISLAVVALLLVGVALGVIVRLFDVQVYATASDLRLVVILMSTVSGAWVEYLGWTLRRRMRSIEESKKAIERLTGERL